MALTDWQYRYKTAEEPGLITDKPWVPCTLENTTVVVIDGKERYQFNVGDNNINAGDIQWGLINDPTVIFSSEKAYTKSTPTPSGTDHFVTGAYVDVDNNLVIEQEGLDDISVELPNDDEFNKEANYDEAFDTVLTFSNVLGHYRQVYTQSSPVSFTLAATGNKAGSVIIQPFISDGINPVSFDFGYRSDLTSGEPLQAGNYDLYFNFEPTTVRIHADKIGDVVAPNNPNKLAMPTITAAPLNSSQIDITIGAIDNATAYLLQSSLDGATNWQTLATTSGGFSHTGLTPATIYYYRVKAIGNTTYPDSDFALTNAKTGAVASTTLVAPTIAATNANSTQNNIVVGTVSNAVSYLLEYSLNGTDGWLQLATTAGTYNHTGLTPATAYYYRAKAVGNGSTYLDSPYATTNVSTVASGNPNPEIIVNSSFDNGIIVDVAGGVPGWGTYQYQDTWRIDNTTGIASTNGANNGTVIMTQRITLEPNVDYDVEVVYAEGNTGFITLGAASPGVISSNDALTNVDSNNIRPANPKRVFRTPTSGPFIIWIWAKDPLPVKISSFSIKKRVV